MFLIHVISHLSVAVCVNAKRMYDMVVTLMQMFAHV